MAVWRAYLLVNLATLLWAGNIVLGRALRHAVGPWMLAGVRAFVASVLFAVLLSRTGGRTEPTTKRDWMLIGAMTCTGVVGFQVLHYAGLRYTTALNSGLVNAAGPLVTLILARWILGQPMARAQMVGAVTSMAGVAIILSGGSWETLAAFRFNPGDALILLAVVMWALYSIAGRVALGRHPTVWVTAMSTMFAVPVLGGPAVWEWSTNPPRWSAGVVLALLYIGAGPSFLAFLSWNEGVRRLGPGGAMAFYNTLPLYAGLLAAVSLGELPGPSQWVGGTLIVGGCLLAARPPRRIAP